MSYQVRADIFPARFTLTNPDGEETVYEKARIVLTLDHVYVFQDATPDPAIVFEDRLTSYTPPPAATRIRQATAMLGRAAQIETEDGYTANFIKSGGCGCGTRLKNMSLTRLMPNDSIAQVVSSNDQ